MPQLVSSVSRTVVQLTASRIYDDGNTHPNQSVMTGFLWKHDDAVYLVTNWHNLAGLRSDTLEEMGAFCPNMLELSFYLRLGQPNDST